MVVSLGLYSLAGETWGVPLGLIINNNKYHLLYYQGAKYFTCILLTVGQRLRAEEGSRVVFVVAVPPCSGALPSGRSPASSQLPENNAGPHGACALPLCGQQRRGQQGLF